MRIVGGIWRGRPLAAPRSRDIRPTSDRLRETVFNILRHAYGEPAPDTRVLDLFAGTGAMGFEALSRGAGSVLFVDIGAESNMILRRNAEALGAGALVQVLRRDATRIGPAAAIPPFALVFCDPPYGRGLAGPALAACREGGWLAPGALVIVEEAVGSGFVPPDGFMELERRAAGETELTIGRIAPAG